MQEKPSTREETEEAPFHLLLERLATSRKGLTLREAAGTTLSMRMRSDDIPPNCIPV